MQSKILEIVRLSPSLFVLAHSPTPRKRGARGVGMPLNFSPFHAFAEQKLLQRQSPGGLR